MLTHHRHPADLLRVERITLPDVHRLVNPADLDERFRLISAEAHQRLIGGDFPEGRIPKSVSGEKHTLVIHRGEMHSVYGQDRLLGFGFHGKVKLAQLGSTGEWVACKIVREDMMRHMELIFSQNMHLLFRTANHHSVHYSYHSKSHDRKKHGFFLKLVPGESVCNTKWDSYSLCSQQLLRMMISILESLKPLHAMNISHNNIRSANVMVDILTCKGQVIDFGSAQIFDENDNHKLKDVLKLLGMFHRYFIRTSFLKSELEPWILSRLKNPVKIKMASFYDDCIGRLKVLYGILPDFDKTYKIRVHDVNEPFDLDHHVGAEVWLVDKKGTATLKDYVAIRNQLQNQEIAVGQMVFKHPLRKKLIYHLTATLKKHHPHALFKLYDGKAGKALHPVRRVQRGSGTSL